MSSEIDPLCCLRVLPTWNARGTLGIPAGIFWGIIKLFACFGMSYFRVTTRGVFCGLGGGSHNL